MFDIICPGCRVHYTIDADEIEGVVLCETCNCLYNQCDNTDFSFNETDSYENSRSNSRQSSLLNAKKLLKRERPIKKAGE